MSSVKRGAAHLDQEEPEPPLIKEEQGELWTSQEGEQLPGLEEADIIKFTFSPDPVNNTKRLLVCKLEWSPSLDQEEPELPHIKEEQEEVWTSQEGEQLQGLNEADIKITNIVSTKSHTWKDTWLDRWRKEDSPSDTAGEGGMLHSSTDSQPITTSGSKHYPCQQCGMSFSCLSKFLRHQLVHTGKRPYLCQQCGKTCSSLSILKSHQRIHTGEKPYHCQQCGKSFSQSSHLKEHLRVHTGEKPYLCQQCGKTFSRLSSLRIHQRVHTGEKPYYCQPCGKSFSRLSNFQTHQRVHTGEKPYYCQQCGKGFSRLTHFKQHQAMHTGKLQNAQ